MKLSKSIRSGIIHGMNPLFEEVTYSITGMSFCGLVYRWENWVTDSLCMYKFYEDSPDTVTCKTCKKLIPKYIIKKLKQKI